VVARGQFRHDAAVFLVHGDLRMQGVGQQACCVSYSARPVSSQEDSTPRTIMEAAEIKGESAIVMEMACKHAPAQRRHALAGCAILPNGQDFRLF
jgi:hypothetical protein